MVIIVKGSKVLGYDFENKCWMLILYILEKIMNVILKLEKDC